MKAKALGALLMNFCYIFSSPKLWGVAASLAPLDARHWERGQLHDVLFNFLRFSIMHALLDFFV